ncbi:hypothetical protein OEZ85_000401 [Tetradesmus obliquus]|uniref:Laminin EGF-like domain-containing protein n=1 Tax=Tetradesmus obliquus TaxID=3088 RepID=A0ABY8UQN9_TETOB|nr:hypothetical protein OEZ85_000401 [Tetradesmus obliquus]
MRARAPDLRSNPLYIVDLRVLPLIAYSPDGPLAPRQRPCLCCAPGRRPHESNKAACRRCPPGSIAPLAGSTKCDKCAEGFTTPNTSRTACSECLPGRAGPSCRKCQPGTWSPGGAAATALCKACLDGTHAVLAGATTDSDCKPMSNSSWQSIAITVTVNSSAPCNATAQQQMADTILLELAARTAPPLVQNTTLGNGTCVTRSDRRKAMPKAVASTYSFAAVSVGLLDSLADLQGSLQGALGPGYTLGVALQLQPAVTLPSGACEGNPSDELLPNALWACNVTLDGQWCMAMRCADNFLPSQVALAAQCVGGKFVKRQGDCFAYSMFPCLRFGQRCAGVPLSTGQCSSDGGSYSCVCIPGATWNASAAECACDPGTSFNETAQACVVSGDACTDNPCAGKLRSTGDCTVDPAAPATGYSCGCITGAVWSAGACQDVNGCTGIPCAGKPLATGGCTDVPAPGTGFSCACVNGAVWADGACKDIDGCASSPCTGKPPTWEIDGSCAPKSCTADTDCTAGGCASTTCLTRSCDTGFCKNTNNDNTPCNDGDVCTVGDTCGGGGCRGGPSALPGLNCRAITCYRAVCAPSTSAFTGAVTASCNWEYNCGWLLVGPSLAHTAWLLSYQPRKAAAQRSC